MDAPISDFVQRLSGGDQRRVFNGILHLRIDKVSSVNSTNKTATLASGVTVHYLTAPVANDTVLLLQQGAALFCLGPVPGLHT